MVRDPGQGSARLALETRAPGTRRHHVGLPPTTTVAVPE
jgi:hypothetical protein